MPTKKKKVTPAPFVFNTATNDYLLRNNGVLTPEAIARDTGATVEAVIAQTKILVEKRDNESKIPTKSDRFDRSSGNGTVSMTGAQSELDDTAPKGDNKAFMEKYKNSIAKINPDKVQG